MKLNKNQVKFFIAAINHFGENSKDVRLKDLHIFANENDLIVPTSALKTYCQEESLVRGHYNLLLTGITPDSPPVSPLPESIDPHEEEEFDDGVEPEEVPVQRKTESVILDTPAFVDPNPIPKRVKEGHYKPEPGQKKKEWKNPVYVVSDGEGDVVGVHYSASTAWERRRRVFRDHGLMDYDDYLVRMDYVGAALIQSAVSSSLFCLIEIKELEE